MLKNKGEGVLQKIDKEDEEMDNRAEHVKKRKDPPGFPYLLTGRSYKKRTENNTSGTSGKIIKKNIS